MKGIGPRPVAKKATNMRMEAAERAGREKRIEAPSAAELKPSPAMEMRREDLRPRMSGRGAEAVVAMRLTIEMRIVRRVAEVGKRSVRMETEYIITEFMPVNCCTHIMPTTAMMAGR
jgi:hypothetical protein